MVVENFSSDGSDGIDIPVTEEPGRRWLRFDFDPIPLDAEGARLEFVENGRVPVGASDGGLPSGSAGTAELRRVVLLGGPGRIRIRDVLGEFAPRPATLSWLGKASPGGEPAIRGSLGFPAGETLVFVGPGAVSAYVVLVSGSGRTNAVVGGGIRFTDVMQAYAGGVPAGEGIEFHWFIGLEGRPVGAAAANLTSIGIRAALPSGRLVIRAEAVSPRSPSRPELRVRGRNGGGLEVDYQPEPGVEHLIETATNPEGPWDVVERRPGTFLPEVWSTPVEAGFRVFRVRIEP